MYRKWKSVSALGLAALMVCLIPMGTMRAAEENARAVQESGTNVSEGDAASRGENTDGNVPVDDGKGSGQENTADGNTDGKEDIDDGNGSGREDAADEETSDVVAAGGKDTGEEETDTSKAAKAPAARSAEAPVSAAAPSISIDWWSGEPTYGPGGQIDFKYVKYQGYTFVCSVETGGQEVSVSYYLDKVTDITEPARDIEQLESLSWIDEMPPSIQLLYDGRYVLYLKAEADGQVIYARSGGVVVDTKAPEITGVEDGGSYPEGTVFKVEDANLESVKVNEKVVTPAADGSYQVRAEDASTSCVIRAVDKAGNEKTCSITISGKDPGQTAISEDGIYALKAGVRYRLGAGQWKVNGGSTIYQGGGTFYVRTDGSYRFTRR